MLARVSLPSTLMRQHLFFLSPKKLLFLLLAPLCLSQTSSIQVGQGATTTTIGEEFTVAYQRNDFNFTVALPPLAEVVAYGVGGFRQEFQDAAKTGLKSALVRPALPDLTLGVNNAVRQVRPPIYAIYTQSGVGVSTAGFPKLDTQRFFVPGSGTTLIGGSYQTFDKNFGIFVWDLPPLEGGTETRFNIADPIFTRWNTIGFDQIGPPVISRVTATSRFGTAGSYQVFNNGAIYVLTSGALSGRLIFVRKSVQQLYENNQGTAGFLGLPLNDETILADGRRRQTFEGGTIEYALNGIPVLKNAVNSISINPQETLRLSAGQTIALKATLQTVAGEIVSDRDVFWSTSNGRVATITGTGSSVSLRAVAGGSALITATSEGKTSNRVTVFVASQCCALGEGAPSQAISQTFIDAVQRNRFTIRIPIAAPVRRSNSGYVQEVIALPAGNRVLLAKSDSSPVAYAISSSLLSSFDALGGLAGSLGYPLSDPSPGGTQRFENGALAGSPLRLLSGAILSRWLALGLETGTLGPPLSERSSSITFTGALVSSQLFRSGALFQFANGPLAGRAILTTGVIAAKHAELGLLAGSIGAPLTEEFLSAGAFRQEFEGAFLEYTQATPVRIITKERKPTLTVSPSSLLPGARFRVAVGGFPVNASLRFTQGSGATADSFDFNAANGSYVWESIVPANARAGVVVLRAAETASAQSFAEGSYTIRTLAELRPTLVRLSGDSQAAAPATTLPAPVRVVLRDSSGNPLSGIPLRFEASPGAAVLSASLLTNSDGIGEARFRLPAMAGVALLAVEAAGQLVTFSARAEQQIPTDFPRVSQAVDGKLGNSVSPLAQTGSLVAAMAASIRFYQQRGAVPIENGLADTEALNNYLRAFCALDANGSPICDGFLDAGPNADLQPNPFRALDFASGALDLSFPAATPASIREAIASSGPVIIALDLSRNGQSAGVHFVTAYGIHSDGDLAISDPNPQFGLTKLSQYTNGFTASASNWLARPSSAMQFSLRGIPAPAFYVAAASPFEVSSPSYPCSPQISWPASFAHLTSGNATTTFRLQACDGSAAAYQLALPGDPFLVSLVSLGSAPSRSIVSGAAATAFRVSRSSSDAWVLNPEQLTINTGAVLNAASFQPRIGVGTIISLFGNGLPLSAGPASTVEWNGQPLPIFFSNGFQLNTAIPVDAIPGTNSLLVRSPYGEASLPIEIADSAPAIFVLDARNAAAVLNQDSTLNSASNPAIRSQAMVIFATGLGAVSRLSSGLSAATNPVSVLLNGRELTPFFAGLTPGFIGLFQVNVVIPASLAPGLDQPIQLRSAGLDSNSGIISIR